MRSKKAVINTVMYLVEELVSIICGFILPRMILIAFGSKYNGLTTSITQFLSCAVLLRSGIGGATRAALYKPLADGDKVGFDRIVKATDLFMKKIGMILAGIIVAFAAAYPLFVSTEFDWFFTFSLFLIIGTSTFAESFFGITYLIVLQADQRVWVSALMKSVCYILNTLIAVLLIRFGASIHIVKLGSAFVYVMYPIALGFYVRKKYKIDKNVEPDNKAISQRWDAFWQQVAAFVMNNTDTIVLTVFSSMLEVSVYSIYNMVTSGLKRIVTAITEGIEGAFGNMIAKGEKRILYENVRIVELMVYGLSTIIFTTGAMLILEFVRIYTEGVTDVDYIRPLFAYISLLSSAIYCIRYPYQLVVQAAGHYKQTRNGAIVEPIINVGLSVVLVIKFGLVGVAIGTFVAIVFRTIQYSNYMRKNIVHRSVWETVLRFVLSLTEMLVIVLVVKYVFNFTPASSYGTWVVHGIITFVTASIIVLIGNGILYCGDCKLFIKKIKRVFIAKGSKNI